MSYHAVLSGVCAGSASFFGKLSGSFEWETFNDAALKIVFLLLMIASNTCVWTFFVKALQISKSSISPTVTSAATNYFCSALTGYLFFDEVTTLLWWAGTSLIISGIIIINKTQSNEISSKQL